MNAPPEPNLDDVDLTDPALYSGPRGYPWREWDLLRREAPVYRYERPGYEPFWAITRHADILAISRNTDCFTQTRTLRVFPAEVLRAMREARLADEAELGPVEAAPSSFIDMDEPHHSRYRRLIHRHFTPRANDGRMELLDRVGRECVERLKAALESPEDGGPGVADLVDAVAMYMPMAVILEMLGVPEEMRMPLYRAVDEGIRDNYTEETVERHRRPGASESHRILVEALDGHRETAATGPTLMDEILRSEVDGEPLSAKQRMGLVMLLVGAGLETTRNAISGGIYALLRHPEQLRKLCDDPSPAAIRAATEEILRWVSPVVHFARTCTRDFELRGTTIRAGEDVAMWYPSANRDEEVFKDPYRFDVARRPNDHLAFGGYGAHFCLGANLARWEIRASLRRLVPWLPRMELAEEPRRFAALGVHVGGFDKLMVRVRD